LIEEGLKEMEIAAVDQGDFDRGALELLRGVQPGEAAAKDQDFVILLHG